MATSFPASPSAYSINPDAFVALARLNLQNPSQSSGTPVSSYGLTEGTPAVQSNTQAALQQALSAALSGGSQNSLQGLVQSMISNPSAARAYAGSDSPAYTPQQPENAWRLNFTADGGPSSWGRGMIGNNQGL